MHQVHKHCTIKKSRSEIQLKALSTPMCKLVEVSHLPEIQASLHLWFKTGNSRAHPTLT